MIIICLFTTFPPTRAVFDILFTGYNAFQSYNWEANPVANARGGGGASNRVYIHPQSPSGIWGFFLVASFETDSGSNL